MEKMCACKNQMPFQGCLETEIPSRRTDSNHARIDDGELTDCDECDVKPLCKQSALSAVQPGYHHEPIRRNPVIEGPEDEKTTGTVRPIHCK